MNSGQTKITLTTADEYVGPILRVLTEYKAEITDLSPVVDLPFTRNRPRANAANEPAGATSCKELILAALKRGVTRRTELIQLAAEKGLAKMTVAGALMQLKREGLIRNVSQGEYAPVAGNGARAKPAEPHGNRIERAIAFRAKLRAALISGEQSLDTLAALGATSGMQRGGVSQALTALLKQKKVRRTGMGTYQIRNWREGDTRPVYEGGRKEHKPKRVASKVKKARKANGATKPNGHDTSSHGRRFAESGDQAVLNLLRARGPMKSAEIVEPWVKQGRSAKALSVQLSHMLKKKLLTRDKPTNGTYSLPTE